MATRQDSGPVKGDLLLEKALKIVVWCESEINPKYRKVLEQKILRCDCRFCTLGLPLDSRPIAPG